MKDKDDSIGFQVLYFLDQKPRLLIFSLCRKQRRLFKGGVYSRAGFIRGRRQLTQKFIDSQTSLSVVASK